MDTTGVQNSSWMPTVETVTEKITYVCAATAVATSAIVYGADRLRIPANWSSKFFQYVPNAQYAPLIAAATTLSFLFINRYAKGFNRVNKNYGEKDLPSLQNLRGKISSNGLRFVTLTTISLVATAITSGALFPYAVAYNFFPALFTAKPILLTFSGVCLLGFSLKTAILVGKAVACRSLISAAEKKSQEKEAPKAVTLTLGNDNYIEVTHLSTSMLTTLSRFLNNEYSSANAGYFTQAVEAFVSAVLRHTPEADKKSMGKIGDALKEKARELVEAKQAGNIDNHQIVFNALINKINLIKQDDTPASQERELAPITLKPNDAVDKCFTEFGKAYDALEDATDNVAEACETFTSKLEALTTAALIVVVQGTESAPDLFGEIESAAQDLVTAKKSGGDIRAARKKFDDLLDKIKRTSTVEAEKADAAPKTPPTTALRTPSTVATENDVPFAQLQQKLRAQPPKDGDQTPDKPTVREPK